MEMISNGCFSSNSSPSSSNRTQIQSPEPNSRSDPNSPYPTTYVTADPSSFKQVIEKLTSKHCPTPPTTTAASALLPPRNAVIPPIKTGANKKKGFKLYERRNRAFMIRPLAADRRTPEILSPTTLDFPSLTLISPVTPLSAAGDGECSSQEEEKAIAENGFNLQPSPRESEPTLLSLFPVTSPTVSHPSSSSPSTMEKPRNLVE